MALAPLKDRVADFWSRNTSNQTLDMLSNAGWERDPTGEHLNRPIGSGGGGQPAAGAVPASGGGTGGGAGGSAGLDLTGSTAVQSIQQAAGGLPSPPPQASVETAMLSGQPGEMRPGLSTRKPPMLQALQRKVY